MGRIQAYGTPTVHTWGGLEGGLPLFTSCRELKFSETRLNSGVLFLLAGLREIGGK